MAKISDEIHKWCAFNEDTFIDNDDCDELRALIDRIDAEMVELPRDMDGAPIHVGDTVYLRDGRKYHVFRINIARDHTSIDVNPFGKGTLLPAIEPTRITHTRPDSWERIAAELDDWCDRVDVDGDACDKPRDLADRIRKLAKEQTNE